MPSGASTTMRRTRCSIMVRTASNRRAESGRAIGGRSTRLITGAPASPPAATTRSTRSPSVITPTGAPSCTITTESVSPAAIARAASWTVASAVTVGASARSTRPSVVSKSRKAPEASMSSSSVRT